jgi:hypothetical protein
VEKIKKFLQGKKTYISAGALALAAILGWWLNAIDSTNSIALLSVAGALAGLGAKSQRTAEAVLAALGNLRDAQEAHARGQKVDVVQLAIEIAKQVGPGVIPGILPISVPSVTTHGASWNPICVYCGLSISANGGACASPNNHTAPDAAGIVRHAFFVGGAVSGAAAGADAK